MIRKLVKLAIVLLLANALYRFVPPYVHYIQFKDAVHQAALFSKGTSDQALFEAVVALAAEHKVPIAPDSIDMSRSQSRTSIDASYVQVIPFAPGFLYPWRFEVKVEATHADDPRQGVR